ncbi:MAG: hypothetical protein AAF629_19645 [Chloroflexota bacterium]
MKHCPHCRELNGKNRTTCFACHQPFSGLTTSSADQQASDASFITVHQIAVPRNTLWNAHQATNLIESLMSLAHVPIKLIISLTASQKVWLVEAPAPMSGLIGKAVTSLYPGTTIRTMPKGTPQMGFRRYFIEAGTEFVAPTKYAEEITQAAPLVNLVNMGRDLISDEQIVLELTLTQPRQDYRLLGEELITTSVIKKSHYHTVGGAIAATRIKSQGKDRVDAYRPQDMELLRDKLNRKLAEVSMLLKIKADSDYRASELVLGLGTTMDLISNEPFNWLTLAEPGETFPLVMSGSEIASLWALPTHHVSRVDGIIWSRQMAGEDLLAEAEPTFYETLGLPPELYTTDPGGAEQVDDHLSLDELEESFDHEQMQ